MGVPGGRGGPRIDGAAVPGSETWQRPLVDAGSAGHALLGTWSVLMATALGTMGLPHVLVRFHTSPDGRSARRTAAITVGAAGRVLPVPGRVRAARGGAAAAAVPLRRDRHGRRRAAVARRPGLARRPVHRAAHRRRLRGVPRDVAGDAARGLRRRLARPHPRRPAQAAPHPAGRRGRRGAVRAARGAGGRRRAGHRPRSRSRPRRSARCSCSGSGGDGSPRGERWWGWPSGW